MLPKMDRCSIATNTSTSRPTATASRAILTLPTDGYRSRLSDFLNASERDFISLTDCVVELIGRDSPGTEHPFIAVSRRHIVFAIPLGEADAALAA